MSSGLPFYELKTKEQKGQTFVFDPLRKKYVVLGPEEHVRQCLIQWLHRERGVPMGLMSVERGLVVDRRRKRYDLVVCDRTGAPLLACECKAPYVPLNHEAALQLAVYNRKLKAPFLLWTNGQFVHGYQQSTDGPLEPLKMLPGYEDMIQLIKGQ